MERPSKKIKTSSK